MPAVLDCYTELAASFINILHCCLPPSGFYDALTIRLEATPSGLSLPPPPLPPNFMPNALFAATIPIYPRLGQAPNNAGLRTW